MTGLESTSDESSEMHDGSLQDNDVPPPAASVSKSPDISDESSESESNPKTPPPRDPKEMVEEFFSNKKNDTKTELRVWCVQL